MVLTNCKFGKTKFELRRKFWSVDEHKFAILVVKNLARFDDIMPRENLQTPLRDAFCDIWIGEKILVRGDHTEPLGDPPAFCRIGDVKLADNLFDLV